MGEFLDRRSSRRARCPTEPHRPAGKAKAVERARVVVLDPRGQDIGFPGRSRCLESLEHGQGRGQALRTGQPRARLDSLPNEQETQEILGRHRLDFATEPIERHPMDPGQEPPLAVLGLVRSRAERPPQRKTLPLEGRQRCRDRFLINGE